MRCPRERRVRAAQRESFSCSSSRAISFSAPRRRRPGWRRRGRSGCQDRHHRQTHCGRPRIRFMVAPVCKSVKPEPKLSALGAVIHSPATAGALGTWVRANDGFANAAASHSAAATWRRQAWCMSRARRSMTAPHFSAIGAGLMRNVLLYFARSRGYERRGAGVHVA